MEFLACDSFQRLTSPRSVWRRHPRSASRDLVLRFLLVCTMLVPALAVSLGDESAGESSSAAKSLGDKSLTNDAIVDFNLVIRPLLSDRCYTCHGPDAENREADLRLDVERDAKEWAIVPGDAEASELVARITADDPDLRMPPTESPLELSPSEIDQIKVWIDQGANWSEHWSFVPPQSPPIPQVQDPSWPQNEIDYFVAARLDRANVMPSPRVRTEKLIRRVTFDITGLPPSVDQLDTLLSDSSPEAFARYVDQLLSSDAYGERMAATWLDVARYSDTYGYQVDRDRYVWPWRDWVIRAFNANMGYDDFLLQQIAGDLLPNASDDQILATTFNRLHPQKVEGGSVPEEFRVEYVADRSQTFSTAFLGLTMECCRCHDHKYDPLTQKEYYQLFSFFDKVDEAGLYSYFTNSVPTPTLTLLDSAAKAEIAELEKRVQDREATLATSRVRRDTAFKAWLDDREQWLMDWEASRTIAPEVTSDGEPKGPQATESSQKSSDQKADPSATNQIDRGPIPGRVGYVSFDEEINVGGNTKVDGWRGKAVRLTGDDAVGVGVGNFRRFDPFSVSLWMNTPDEKERAVVFHRSRAWTDAGSRGYQLLIENGRLSASLIHFWPGNAIRVRTVDKLAVDQWAHVTITYDGSSRANGLRIHINGELAETTVVRDNLRKNITGGGGDHIAIGERFRDKGFRSGLVDEFQVFDRELTALEIRHLCDERSFTDAMSKPIHELTNFDLDALRDFYFSVVDNPHREFATQLRMARKVVTGKLDAATEIMVMREMPGIRMTRLLNRGAYDAPGDIVESDTPASLPRFPKGLPRNRLGLARWLTSRQHPLTARVAVNRIWQMMLGEGLVRTPEDFGSQGELPTHPELLDWLATDFVSHGWDVKRLVRQIVTSATYQQSTAIRPDLVRRDPENRLLARATSYRLSAEMLRDNVLAASELLVNRLGGPPAKPYEVKVSFKPVERDKGEGLYRRSVYTYWKRTGPAPVMMTLDASKRDVCRVKRERTASPLQAFVMLNDPQFVEAARVLGQRALSENGDDTNAALTYLFRVLSSRHPTDGETHVLHRLFEQQVSHFQEHAEAAAEFLHNGDMVPDEGLSASRLAAISVVACTLMNFDECVMKK